MAEFMAGHCDCFRLCSSGAPPEERTQPDTGQGTLVPFCLPGLQLLSNPNFLLFLIFFK